MKKIVGIIIGIILVFGVLGYIGSRTETKNVTAPVYRSGAPIGTEVGPEIQSNACDYDWTFTSVPYIGDYYIAPDGYRYVIVDIYLKNNGDKAVSTNPYFWNIAVNGIKYTCDLATFDSSIHSQTVEVGKGGEIETHIVYLVNGIPTEANLEYGGLSGPNFLKVNHYNLKTLNQSDIRAKYPD
jgi:hypothetical protein